MGCFEFLGQYALQNYKIITDSFLKVPAVFCLTATAMVTHCLEML